MNSRPISENPVNLFRTREAVAEGGYRCVWGYPHPNGGQYYYEPQPNGPSLPPPDWVFEGIKQEYLVVTEDSRYLTSRPVSPEAYLEFADLALGESAEKEAIIRFASRHGWLGFSCCIHPDAYEEWPRRLGSYIPVTQESAAGKVISSRYVVRGESLSRWKIEIMDYVAHFRLWRAAQEKDVIRLRESIKLRKGGVAEFEWGRPKDGIGLPSFISKESRDFDWNTFPPGSLIELAKAFVIRRINQKLEDNLTFGVRFTGHPRDPFRVEPYVLGKTLLSAIWLQFSQVLTGVSVYKTCGICNKLMDVSECVRKGSKRFHEKCSGTARMARYRQKPRA